MSLDLGELRASVVIDRSAVRPGLAGVEQEIQRFARKLDDDTKRAGGQAGANLGGGLAGRVRAHLRDVTAAGKVLGREFSDAWTEEAQQQFPRGLRSVGDRIKSWGRGVVSDARTTGRGMGSGLSDGMSHGVGLMGGVLRGGTKLLAGFAAGGAAALGLVTGAAVVMGTKVASANEQATIAFSTMLRKAGDTEATARKRAQAFIGDLQKLAATTPFEFADLQDYSAKLVSAGVETDKIIPIMKNLGDVTSGVGTGAEGIDRATVALQQMIAAQKISAEDLNQLRDAGIPVYDLLAGATGKSKKEIVDLANKGKLGKKELDALLDTLADKTPKGLEKFNGLMQKQSETLQGQWSNLSDTVSQGLGRAAQRAMPELKRGLAGISGLMSSVFGYLDKHGDDIERIFGAGGRAASSFWGIVKHVLTAFTGGLGDGQDVLTGLADWLDTHQADMIGFFVGLGEAAIGFGQAAAVVVSGVLHGLAGLTKGFGAAMAFMQDRLAQMNDNMANIQDGLGFHGAAKDSRAKAQQYRDDAAATRADTSGQSAENMAKAIDSKLLPSLDAAQRGLEQYGKQAQDAARRGDEWRGSLDSISRSVDENGRSLSSHTKAGKANRKAIRDSIDALNDDAQAAYDNKAAKGDLKGAEKAAAKVIRDGTGDIRDQARKAGLNKDAVDGMIGKLKKVPKEVHTDITFSTNAGKVLVELKTGKAQKDAHANTEGTNRPGFARGGQLPGRTPLHRGDDMALPVVGGGWQPLRGGELVQVTESADPYEVRRNQAMNNGVLAGLSPARVRDLIGEGKARGGQVGQTAVPASVADLGPAATAFAERNARAAAEAYAKATKRQLEQAASGGNTGAALAYARAHEGHPYVFGTLWDCSGLVSALHSIALGEQPHRRYSTTAFHGAKAQGFTRDKQSNFMIGVNPNPGKSGHMVARINGVGVEEAGGVGLRVGASARSINDPMFSWHGGLAYGGRVRGVVGDMPMDLINPRGGRRYSPILADLAEALASGRGYANGTASAAPGFHWTGEKAAELVVNPQMRRYSGGEQVLQVGKAKDGGQAAPIIGQVTFAGRTGIRSELSDLHYAVRSLRNGRAGGR